jgi:hypothetical protein
MKGKTEKYIFSGGGYQLEGTRKRRMRIYMVDYFISTYENRRMKPVEIVLRMGIWEKRENDGGSKSN